MTAASFDAEADKKLKARESSKAWYHRNKEKVSERYREYYKANKDKINSRITEYKALNKDKVRESQKRYRQKTKTKQREYDKAYRLKHGEQIREKDRTRALDPKTKAARNKRLKRRYDADVNYRAALVARRMTRRALRSGFIKEATAQKLGCSLVEFKAHIESLWLDGMTWKNNTNEGWHIDHIIPLSKFDLRCPLQQKLACHFTNLQPLWAKDNLKKGNKLA